MQRSGPTRGTAPQPRPRDRPPAAADEAAREARLASLAREYRVWAPFAGGACDTTPGLIALCRDWIRPHFEMVEVGCFRGVSTRIFACFAWRVWAVDPWTLATRYREIPPEFVARAEAEFNAACAGQVNIVRVQDFSTRAAERFPRASLDLVYLDGEHSQAAFAADVAAWLPKLRPGGLLTGHDYPAVGRYFDGLRLPSPLATYPDSSWVVWVDHPELVTL